MADIILFTPRAELDTAENIAGFVSSCRDHMTVFGHELPFDSDQWDVSESSQQRGLSHRIRINFSNLETVREKRPKPMAEPFKIFAKAYIRYMQGHRPAKNIQFRLGALRALEHATRTINGSARVELIDLHCLNRAAQLIKEHWGASAAYRVGGQLEAIANFLNENHLTGAPVKWATPLPRPTDTERIGKEADKRRQARLPTPLALEALATAFHTATEPADVVIAATAALLCSTPDRINEVLTLPADCEVRSQYNGKPTYGLRWWPSKGAEPMVKWVLPAMQGIVETAIAKLRLHMDHARQIAKWYERNPGKLWLPEELEHVRDTTLTVPQVARCLNFPRDSSAVQWLRSLNVPAEIIGGRLLVRFAEVERTAVALLPKNFPIMDSRTGLRYSEALFVVNMNFFHAEKRTFDWMIEPVNQQHISDGLGGACRARRGLPFQTFKSN